MPSFIENIYSLRLKHPNAPYPPHGPAIRVPEGQLLVSDYDGHLYELAGLPDAPALVAYGDDLGPVYSPQLSTYRRNASGSHTIACFWSRQTETFGYRLFSADTGQWSELAIPPPPCHGAPLASAELGGWVGNEVVVFSVQPRFGRISEAALTCSRYALDGRLVNEQRLLAGSERGLPSFGTPDVFWCAHAGDGMVAFAWNRLFCVDHAGVTTLPAPRGVDHLQPYQPSAVHAGKMMLFSHDDAHEAAFLYDIDLLDWSSTRQDVSKLLRGSRGATGRWMPLTVQVVMLGEDWILLDLHDRDPLNRVACWLWQRSSNRAWGVPMKEFGERQGLTFQYLAECDRFIASDDDELLISRPLEQIFAMLQATPARAKTLPAPAR